jgi:hypothetical protein
VWSRSSSAIGGCGGKSIDTGVMICTLLLPISLSPTTLFASSPIEVFPLAALGFPYKSITWKWWKTHYGQAIFVNKQVEHLLQDLA